jgi:hypothetical protein
LEVPAECPEKTRNGRSASDSAAEIDPVHGLPTDELSPEVVPLADGSALVYFLAPPGPPMYWLREDSVKPISMAEPGSAVDTGGETSTDLADFLFVENGRLRRELSEAREADSD